jgi:hypothetical protein
VCSAGTGAAQCTACANGTVSSDPASVECYTCGANTVADEIATDCTYQCSNIQFVDGERVYKYDLTNIG